MSVNEYIDWFFLEPYFAGTASASERAEVESWITENASRVDVERLREMWEWRQCQRAGGADRAIVMQRVFDAIQRGGEGAGMVKGAKGMHWGRTTSPGDRLGTRTLHEVLHLSKTYALASIASLAFITAVFSVTHWWLLAPPHPIIQLYTTAREQRIVALPSGAQVRLASATTLRVETLRNAEAGIVATVDGAALFSVPHQDRVPFVVRTGAVVVHVLGTTFLVRHYAGDPTQVVVTDGRVAVHIAPERRTPGWRSSETVLSVGALATVADSGALTVTPNVVVDDYTGWATGHLVFKKTPLFAVLAELSRVYGVTVTCDDSTLADRTFTFTANIAVQSLTDVLNALVIPLDAHYTRSGGTVSIVPGRSRSQSSTVPSTLTTPELSYGR